jgi:hypothetical protein
MAAAQMEGTKKARKAVAATEDDDGWTSDVDKEVILDAYKEVDAASSGDGESSSSSDDDDDEDDEADDEDGEGATAVASEVVSKDKAKPLSFCDIDTGEEITGASIRPAFPGRVVASRKAYTSAIFTCNKDYAKVCIAGELGSYRGVVLADRTVLVLRPTASEKQAIVHLPLGSDKLTPHFATKVAQQAGGGKSLSMSTVMVRIFGDAVETEQPPIMSYPLAIEIKKAKKAKRKREAAAAAETAQLVAEVVAPASGNVDSPRPAKVARTTAATPPAAKQLPPPLPVLMEAADEVTAAKPPPPQSAAARPGKASAASTTEDNTPRVAAKMEFAFGLMLDQYNLACDMLQAAAPDGIAVVIAPLVIERVPTKCPNATPRPWFRDRKCNAEKGASA